MSSGARMRGPLSHLEAQCCVGAAGISGRLRQLAPDQMLCAQGPRRRAGATSPPNADARLHAQTQSCRPTRCTWPHAYGSDRSSRDILPGQAQGRSWGARTERHLFGGGGLGRPRSLGRAQVQPLAARPAARRGRTAGGAQLDLLAPRNDTRRSEPSRRRGSFDSARGRSPHTPRRRAGAGRPSLGHT